MSSRTSFLFRRFAFAVLLIVGLVGMTACQPAYFRTMEAFGRHKRDILVDRVTAARDSQEDAKKQFRNALERFREVVEFEGGYLEDRYKNLKSELSRSESQAKDVRKRINAVEDVGEALFREWEAELDQYGSRELRRASERQMADTRQRYDRMVTLMNQAESRIDPVLQPLRDHVLFLKHNLNARAISSLDRELIAVQTDVDVLVRQMERAISEADTFLRSMPRN